ncbi:MAG: prepilin-type N-terminal cleavage/methylation domain-containing protein, partial [Actinomycetota bacterium]
YKLNALFKEEKGFTIVEMLLVSLVVAIIATIISMLYISSIRSQKDLFGKAGAEANLRTTMYSVSQDIRGASDVSIAGNDYIKFTSGADIVEFVLVSSGGTYVLNKKTTSGGSTTTKFIMEYITNNNIFSYYVNDSGSALSIPLSAQNLADFKLVNLIFTVNKEYLNPDKDVSLSTMVSLRNRP